MEELYKTHRPKTFKTVYGQKEAVAVLTEFVKNKSVPHTLLFTGPSGCGKTTLARILKTKLLCSDIDFNEMNCAQFRGIDMVRDISGRIGLAPIGGECRIWLIDEAHQLTGPAQDAFLKILEDTPKHVYFFLATTDPAKLKNTIKTRSTEVRLKTMSTAAMEATLEYVLSKEGKTITPEVQERLIEVADGSARKAMVILNQIIYLETEEQQLRAIANSDSKTNAIEIWKTLMGYGGRPTWTSVAKVLQGMEIANDDVESIRHLVLSCCTNVMLKGGKGTERAFVIIQSFRDPFYESKRAGLVAACYEVIGAK